MLTLPDVSETIARHLQMRPDAADYVRPLQAMIDAGTDVLARTSFGGHVTASAFVTDPAGRLLLIRHNALGRWLQPGGHVERTDASLFASALRELREEVGLTERQLWAPVHMLSTPVEIDCHRIPASERKNEPAHDHWDFRFLFLMRDPGSLALQLDEVSAADWVPAEEFDPKVAEAIQRVLS